MLVEPAKRIDHKIGFNVDFLKAMIRLGIRENSEKSGRARSAHPLNLSPSLARHAASSQRSNVVFVMLNDA